jgi:purine-nucleoside/S-methyl-5'-thioadenosine phosphorylase / adenosine deaminase
MNGAVGGGAGFILPDWPAPSNVRTLVTTRSGGCSSGGYASLNLANHVGDELESVLRNRRILSEYSGLAPGQFSWLDQVHGQNIISASNDQTLIQADGSDTQEESLACVVLTADCLPVLLCDTTGTKVAAIHAGWRGLAGGILHKAVQRFSDASQVMAWLGPAISQTNFEVGDEVYQAFVARSPQAKKAFIQGDKSNKWLADIYQLALIHLKDAGVQQVYGGGLCTFSDAERFYSFRRDGQESGRMASLIWRQNN